MAFQEVAVAIHEGIPKEVGFTVAEKRVIEAEAVQHYREKIGEKEEPHREVAMAHDGLKREGQDGHEEVVRCLDEKGIGQKEGDLEVIEAVCCLVGEIDHDGHEPES